MPFTTSSCLAQSLIIIATFAFKTSARPNHNQARAEPVPPPRATTTPSAATSDNSATPTTSSLSSISNTSSTSSSAIPLPPAPTTAPSSDTNGSNGVIVNNQTQTPVSSVVNYYFLLLGLFIALLILIYWILIRRRKSRKLRTATTRRSALAADLSPDRQDSQPGGRFGGFQDRAQRAWRWRYGGSSLGGDSTAHREEGLDEHGEAPPPYLAKAPPAVTVNSRRGLEEEHEGMQLRCFYYNEAPLPPEYSPPASSSSAVATNAPTHT